ncbi:riboflavin kinase / FMN adenylyltransferase [Thiothrix eikelboomii]|uniref:Riboflavin biosynthesis protein n=1 Tax=Thiothrix eikelboomii TaxID=92487 RepID=A0A1T4XHS4_9GAMM|nr:bifunctional riboflavin kinase/FAD synthetase [Thiothrix eikelboomii]SKA88658.1 riboflavin kinase / FMN adenylyltransferase [Thiothrix eikelboomii]
MKLLRSWKQQTPPCIATIGNFDGLHLGHQGIIQQVKAHAAHLGWLSTVISFEPLPAEYLRQPPPTRILPLRDKLIYLQTLDIDQFACLTFNSELATMEPEDFIQDILLAGLQVRALVVGDDFRFGRKRRGDYQMLQTLGAKQGMEVVQSSTIVHTEERVSSTWVREALAKANLSTVNTLLGRAYTLSGRVRHGDKLGRTIGFPTLNLRIPENIALRKGVYAVHAFQGRQAPIKGIANLGARPTVNGLQSRLEVHLFDFSQQVYQQHWTIEPITFIRDEQRFASFEHLKQQISRDVEQAHSLLH